MVVSNVAADVVVCVRAVVAAGEEVVVSVAVDVAVVLVAVVCFQTAVFVVDDCGFSAARVVVVVVCDSVDVLVFAVEAVVVSDEAAEDVRASVVTASAVVTALVSVMMPLLGGTGFFGGLST